MFIFDFEALCALRTCASALKILDCVLYLCDFFSPENEDDEKSIEVSSTYLKTLRLLSLNFMTDRLLRDHAIDAVVSESVVHSLEE